MYHGGGWWSFIRYDEDQKSSGIDRELLKRVLKYGRPYWKQIAVMMLTITAVSLVELVPPLLYRDLIDNVLPNRDFRRLNLLAIAMIGAPVLAGLLNVAQRYLSARVGESVIFDLRQQMYAHLQRMGLRFFTETKSGEIISRFNNDVIGAQQAVTGTLPNIFTNIVTLVSTLIVMASIEWRLTLISVLVFPMFLLPARRVGRILRDIRRRAMTFNAEMSSLIKETLGINGALLVKTFGREGYEVDRFRSINEQVRDIGVRRALIGRWFFMGMSLVGAMGTALVYWIGGHLVLRDSITIGTIVAFAAYLTRLYRPISALSNVQVEFVSSLVSFERVFEYLDLPVEIQDRRGALELNEVKGLVRFEDVWFSYHASPWEEPPAPSEARTLSVDGRENSQSNSGASSNKARYWALKDLSFKIEPGQLVALVGPSGAGKTTVTYLLPRLYDPTQGRITIDGHNLRDVTQESLANQIGMVAQEAYLLHDTLRSNLQYAKLEATQAEMEAACRAAHIHDLIAGLPEGYDTVVGERGYRLSGGEKQRIAIARVILKDPRILILDEATSHLDSQSEALIQRALQQLLEGRTSLVIAHRLSTILAADLILVLDGGRVVERGTHEELLAQGGLYASLYETQFGDEAAERTAAEPLGT